MSELSENGRRIVGDLSARHGFSQDAVTHVLMAMIAGFGNQAQFNHFELGGMGQWSSGGMMMIGDMFNNQLKYRVGQLCNDLSNAVRNDPQLVAPAQSQSQSQGGFGQFQGGGFGSSFVVTPPGGGTWWPSGLGSPASTGSQNSMRYAYFPSARRLAVDAGSGEVWVYDTGDHQIGGFSQQQGGDQSITLTSQFGTVRLNALPVVSRGQAPVTPAAAPSVSGPSLTVQAAPPTQFVQPVTAAQGHAGPQSSDIIGLIEKLAELRSKGVLSDSEFETKKAELLSRL